MTQDRVIKYVLEFPEGNFLIISRPNDSVHTPYFLPHHSNKAYHATSKAQHLMGKFHHQMVSQSEEIHDYNLTYEIEGKDLISARLITATSKSKGKLANTKRLKKLQKDFKNEKLVLIERPLSPEIEKIAKFPDGRFLIQIRDFEHNNFRTLLIGRPGNYKKVNIHEAGFGGGKTVYTTKENIQIVLPSGNNPVYGSIQLEYIIGYNRKNLQSYGIPTPPSEPHLDPFYQHKARTKRTLGKVFKPKL